MRASCITERLRPPSLRTLRAPRTPPGDVTAKLPIFALPIVALLSGACTAPTPLRIIDAAAIQDSQSVAGPYRFQALVGGGAGALTVQLRLAVESPDGTVDLSLETGCRSDFPPAPGRGLTSSSAAPGPPSGCITLPMSHQGGELYGVDWRGPPFSRRTTLRAVIHAVDATGQSAWWPEGAPAESVRWQLGPPGRLGLTDLAPAEGPVEGGARVLIRGTGFSEQTTVWFGAERAVAQLESPHLLEATTPPGLAGLVDVTLDDGVERVVRSEGFRYLPPPQITGLDPREGPSALVTLVTLQGEHFAPGARLLVSGEAALEARWWSAERLTVQIPAGPPGAVALTVEQANGQISGQAWFLRRAPPVLEAIEPTSGPDLGGNLIELRGQHLRTPGAVWLDERRAEVVEVLGETRARVRTPPAPAGTVSVRWYNPDGQSAELRDAYTFLGPPRLVAVEPGVTSRCGGGLVELIGRGFQPGSAVTFNGVPAEVVEAAADGTRLVVRAPPGTSGPIRIRITNPDGRADGADDLLEFGVRPVIYAVEPAEAPVWGGTVVTITGADFSADAEVSFGPSPAEQSRLEPSADGCDGLIIAVVPAGSEGPVAVQVESVADGGRATRADGLVYVAPRLTPAAGLVPGYANLTLEGLDLRPGLIVRFGERLALDSERRDDRLWRLRTPAGAHGLVDVEVRNADGRGVTLPGGFRYRRFEEHTAATGIQPIGDCNDVSVADVDGDGRLDLVTANGALGAVGLIEQPVGVHRGRPDGRFASEALRPAGNGMNAKLGDIDGDGDLDLLVANLAGGPTRLFRNDRGRFVDVPGFPARASAYDAGLIDVDGDGDLDVFLLRTGDPEDNLQQGPEQLWINDGRGRFVQAVGAVPFDPADVHDHAVGFGDLTGNGLPDAVIVVDNLSAQFAGASNRLLINRGGRFEEAASPFNDYPGDWLHAEIADLDGDGDLDVLLPQDFIEGFSRPGTPAMALYLNDGAGRFVEAPERIVGMPRVPAFEAVAVDLDGDGDLDLAVAVFGFLFADGTIEPFESLILLNDGAGVFHQASAAFERPFSIASTDFGPGDFDGDGAIDLFECAARGESLVWFQR